MGHSPFACLLSESSISIKMAAYEEEMPLASEIPHTSLHQRHVAHQNQSA